MRYSGIARLIAMAFIMLLAPLTVSAAGSHAYALFDSENGVVDTRHADAVLDTAERLGSPVEAPLHCHLKSSHAQASGLAKTSVEVDLPSLALIVASAHARKTEMRSPAILTCAPIAGPPRFILFGNFRS